MSKQFTAACILLLASEGHLSLDDNVHRYWPEFLEYGARLTVRHLLYHTSGLRDDIDLWALAGRSYEESFDNDDLVHLLRSQKSLNFVPGTEQLYSNANYLVLAQLVRLVRGETLREYADENLFGPLAMEASFFDDGTVARNGRVSSYRSREHGLFKPYVHKIRAVGSGGLCTTVEDLCRWDKDFWDEGLPAKSIADQMLQPGRLDSGEPVNFAFGLQHGWHKGLSIVHSPGSMLGFRCQLLKFPEQRLTVICLANVDDFDRFHPPLEIADIFLAGRFQVAEFVGDYHSDELGVTWTLSERDGDMFLSYDGIAHGPLKSASIWQMGFDSFMFFDPTMGVDVGVEFERDEDSSAVSGFTLSTYRVRNLRFAKQ